MSSKLTTRKIKKDTVKSSSPKLPSTKSIPSTSMTDTVKTSRPSSRAQQSPQMEHSRPLPPSPQPSELVKEV